MARNTPSSRDLDAEIGRKVKESRLAKGWSRQQLAIRIDVTHQQLHKYEKGTNRVSAGRLAVIAGVLERPIEYFVSIEKSVVHPRDRISLEMMRVFSLLSAEAQDAMVSLARAWRVQ